MNPIDFYSARFETEIGSELQVGDEVIDRCGIKAVVLRNPYHVGMHHELFTQISYGLEMSSQPVVNLKKTGRSYAKELRTILDGLSDKNNPGAV